MARFCTSCGTQAAADDRFCAACGARLPRAEPPPVTSPEPPTPAPPVISGGSEAAGSDAAAPGRSQPDGDARPLVPDSPGSAGSGGERGRFSRNAIIAILAAVALVLSGTVAALTLTRTSSPPAVTLQPAGTPGINPFMPPAGTDQPGLRLVKGSGGTLSGGTPGLYGGTLRKASCNPQQMVSFLRAHPDKAAAWASVLGIRPAGIPGYVADLTPVVLRSDTAVTNHGYADGHVTSFPAVLQAGTAVLIDRYGQPVTKCFCGNPLTRPTAYTRPAYTGKRWPSFSPASVTYIQQTTIIVNSFTLVDPATGATFRRRPGSSGSADQPVVAGTPTSSFQAWVGVWQDRETHSPTNVTVQVVGGKPTVVSATDTSPEEFLVKASGWEGSRLSWTYYVPSTSYTVTFNDCRLAGQNSMACSWENDHGASGSVTLYHISQQASPPGQQASPPGQPGPVQSIPSEQVATVQACQDLAAWSSSSPAFETFGHDSQTQAISNEAAGTQLASDLQTWANDFQSDDMPGAAAAASAVDTDCEAVGVGAGL